MRLPSLLLLALAPFAALSCAETRGSTWMAQPLGGDDPSWAAGVPATTRGRAPTPTSSQAPVAAPQQGGKPEGRVLGVFRNTYYHFPSEADFSGTGRVPVMSASCSPVAEVERGFYESLCVQGSGRLASGQTVSFAKRDCACAEVCPRTGQKICFEALDRRAFPFGRGAMGRAITPMRTVAVDPKVIPLGSPVYIEAIDGLPVGEGGAPHDGCFLAEDRGMKVQGQHIDIFTGEPRATQQINGLVPSNKGVRVMLDVERCKRLAP